MPITIPDRTPCPFCRNFSGDHPCAFVHRDDLVASFVNPRQYGHGALLVSPIRHAPTLFDLTDDEIDALYRHARDVAIAIRAAFDPDGFNVFQNNGVAAGQSVPHVHVHVVPRRDADDVSGHFSEKNYTPSRSKPATPSPTRSAPTSPSDSSPLPLSFSWRSWRPWR